MAKKKKKGAKKGARKVARKSAKRPARKARKVAKKVAKSRARSVAKKVARKGAARKASARTPAARKKLVTPKGSVSQVPAATSPAERYGEESWRADTEFSEERETDVLDRGAPEEVSEHGKLAAKKKADADETEW